MRLNSRLIQWGDRTGFVLEDADADEFERPVKQTVDDPTHGAGAGTSSRSRSTDPSKTWTASPVS